MQRNFRSIILAELCFCKKSWRKAMHVNHRNEPNFSRLALI